MIYKLKKSRVLALVLSLMMVMTAVAVPAFAADDSAAVTAYTDVTLIGSTPYAGATSVAPGSGSSQQPIRLAFSAHASEIAENINSYVAIKQGTATLDIANAAVENNIVVINLTNALESNKTYTVDFNDAYLSIDDFEFTTSKGGTGGGTGGGTPTSQALVLTGKIPTDNVTVSGSQIMYLTFSTNIKSKAAANVKCITIKDSADNTVSADVQITDNWTAKITSNALTAGNIYTLNVSTNLEAQSTNKLETAVEIPFTVA